MLDNFFYSSMSNVLTKWSDFRVSRHLYKAYYNSQKTESASKNAESSRRKINYKNSFSEDKLGSLSESVSKAVSGLESGFAADKETGEINYGKAYSAAESFVKSYNDLVSGIRKSGDKQISGKHQFIANMTNAYSRRLENVGITVGSDGKLSIDKEKFNSASARDLDAVFGKKGSFADFMSSQASQLSKYAAADKTSRNSSTYTQSGAKKTGALSSGELLNFLK